LTLVAALSAGQIEMQDRSPEQDSRRA